MFRVHRVSEQRPQGVRRGLEVVDRLEEGRHVQCRRGAGPAGHLIEIQNGQDIIHVPGHADDIGAHRVRTVAGTALVDGDEDVQRLPDRVARPTERGPNGIGRVTVPGPPSRIAQVGGWAVRDPIARAGVRPVPDPIARLRIRVARRGLVGGGLLVGPVQPNQGLSKPFHSEGHVAIGPALFSQEDPGHVPVSARMLADIQGRHVEAEHLGPPDRPHYGKTSRVTTSVREQAPVDGPQVFQIVGGAPVAAVLAGSSGLQPGPHEGQEGTVSHGPMPRPDAFIDLRVRLPVPGDDLIHLLGPPYPGAGLAQMTPEPLQLRLVQAQDEGLMASQGSPHGLCVDGRIPIHVAPDPGREPDQRPASGQRGAITAGSAIPVLEGFTEHLVQGRHHTIEHGDEIEEHVFHLVAHGRPDRGVFLRLPGRGDLGPDASLERPLFRGRQRGIESVQ